MKKKRPLQVSFYDDGFGWILLRLNLPEKTVKINLSSVFDPFEDLYKWLEDICFSDFPSEIIISEEGSEKKLIATKLTKDAKDSFLLRIFDLQTNGEKLLVKSELSKKDFVFTFIDRFESFVKRKPNVNWSSYQLSELRFGTLYQFIS